MRYLILGVTEARDEDGTPLPVGGVRLRSLLAALALHAGTGHPVPVDTLISQVWAGTGGLPADAPAALQALVGRLRRTVGAHAVRSHPGGYRLATDPDDVDLHRFHRLAAEGESAHAAGDPATAATRLDAALALWRGPALADLPELTASAARCEAARHTAHVTLLAARVDLGEPARALPDLARLARSRPLDEPLHALRIRALRDAGRRAEALQAYETVRRALDTRLGTDPGRELRALHTELLAPDRTPPPAPGAGPRRHEGNLRSRLTSFVGRERELGTLAADLHRSRLVTLTGPGGSGKTSLAERAAATAGTAWPDGVWMAELASLDQPSAVPGAVLSALGRRATTLFTTGPEAPRRPAPDRDDALTRLLEHLADRRLLLVLDNCEHLADAAARLTETLLTRCPGLTVLATSREPLGVPGEVLRPVEPLPPAPAHRLFTDRAADVSPAFHPDGDPGTVTEICTRLDGLPLAIELAAARLRSLTPRQVAARLDDRFRLLTSGSRTVLPRQQTLRAVVDWSWELLSADERTVLRRLSVFAGGCTLAAAEDVCADDDPDGIPAGAVAGLLAALVDKSLLVAAPAGTGLRYRMLETIHAYARERAAEHPDDRARAAGRHTARTVRLTATAADRLRTGAQLSWMDCVEADLDNIRAALARTLGSGSPDALRLIRAMGWFWWLRNYREEGAHWVRRALDRFPADSAGPGAAGELPHRELQIMHYFLLPEFRVRTLLEDPAQLDEARKVLTVFSRDEPAAARFPGMLWPLTAYLAEGADGALRRMDTAVATCRRHGGGWELAVAVLSRAHLRLDSPDADHSDSAAVAADLAELDALAEGTGDRWLLGQAAGLRAEIAVRHGRCAEARGWAATALEHARRLGARTELPALSVRIAEIRHREGHHEEADGLARRAVEDAERLGLTDICTYGALLRATIAAETGDTARARTLHGHAREHSAAVAPVPLFAARLLALDAHLTLAEGGSAHDALGLAKDALDAVTGEAIPAATSADLMLTAAETAVAAGHLGTALRFADAARTHRGPLAPTDAAARTETAVRTAARHAEPSGPAPATPAEARGLLERLLARTLPEADVSGR